MKKKVRKLLKKNFLELKNAFSLVEIAISLLVISIIIAALTPTISKRLTSASSMKPRISTNCDSLYPSGYCAMCYITPKKCITCTRTCQSNEYKNVGNCECEKCIDRYNDPHCTKCDSKKCNQCDPGYYLDGKGKCTICPKGHYCYQTADGGSKIEQCKPGTAAPREGMNKCDNCLKSTATQQGSVATNKGQTTCTLCGAGTYAKDTAQTTACQPCTVGHKCANGKFEPCAKGEANNRTGQTACIACVKSSTSSQGSVATNTGMTQCTLCGNGQFASVTGQTTNCEPCKKGHYCPSGKYIICPKGTAQGAEGQSSCVNCKQSTTTVGGSVATTEGMYSCTACGNGYFALVGKQTTSCQLCPDGYMCPGGRKIPCAVGSVSSAGASACTSCGSGKTSPAASKYCVSCNSECAECYSSGSNCTSCKPGYYKSGSNCIRCSAGYYCPGGTSGQISCGSGKTSAAGASACVTCAGGCSTCQNTANNCTACKAGYWKSGSSCAGCTSGYYCPGGTTARQYCGANMGSRPNATSASDCYPLWNCSTYGGTVAGSLCYKKTAQGSCSGTPVSGHTWRPATVNDVKIVGQTSFFAGTTTCTSYSRYGACTRYGTSCTVITFRAGYYVSSTRYTAGYYAPPNATQSTSSYCPANQTICVANN